MKFYDPFSDRIVRGFSPIHLTRTTFSVRKSFSFTSLHRSAGLAGLELVIIFTPRLYQDESRSSEWNFGAILFIVAALTA